jgi:hypothetical protein
MSTEQPNREGRAPATTDFHVDVDGIGHFVFARRTMRDEMRISAEYSRFTEGLSQPTNYLDSMAGWIATLNVLTVSMPHNWDPENMDPFDPESEENILKVYSALRIKEGSFRPKKEAASEGSGQGNGPTSELLVSPPVPPAAD